MKNRSILIVLAVTLLAVAGSIYAWLGTGKMRFRSELRAYGDGAKEVVLERYYSGTVLQTARIPGEQFQSWADQLPEGFGRLPYAISKCWVPHHRIKFDGNTENKVEICFTCNELWTEATGRRKIPKDWRQPLRAMFQAYDIPDAAPDSKEQSEFFDKMMEELEEE